jgi:hypothetical protein
MLNTNTKRFHDRRFYTRQCNLDDGIIGFEVAKTWRETDLMSSEDMRVYTYCKRCARQERYEMGAAQG